MQTFRVFAFAAASRGSAFRLCQEDDPAVVKTFRARDRRGDRICGRTFRPATWYALVCPACVAERMARLPWRRPQDAAPGAAPGAGTAP